MTAPIDRSSPEYREYVRTLAQAKRRPPIRGRGAALSSARLWATWCLLPAPWGEG